MNIIMRAQEFITEQDGKIGKRRQAATVGLNLFSDGTVFLQNTDELTDETGTQTLTAVGTAAGNALNPF